MARLDSIQLARKDAQDIIRTKVRLESRIEVRRRLNDLENEVLEEFDRRVLAGESFGLTAAEILE